MGWLLVLYMKLIADAGSSKTSWALIQDNQEINYYETSGIDPFCLTKEEIIALVVRNLPEVYQKREAILEIRYFGTGANYAQCIELIKNSLEEVFSSATIYVQHDLLGTAISLCKDKAGIACILGTGSNSCYYDGQNITQQVAAPGYILADEGSGAYLGRLFLLDFIREDIPSSLRNEFIAQYNITVEHVMEGIYRSKEPNKYLASFVPFLKKNIENAYCEELVKRSFDDFYKTNIARYKQKENTPINFTGGIAHHFSKQLNDVLESHQCVLGAIVQQPIKELALYYQQL